MALNTLESLVLRGVAVLRDGVAVEARLGLGYQGTEQSPASISMRHPSSHNPRHGNQPDARTLPGADKRQDRVAPRAGRPGCAMGVPHSRSRAVRATGSLARRVLQARGSSLTAVWRLCRIAAGAPAAGAKARSGRFPTATTTTRLQATRGLTASRRLHGGKRGSAFMPGFTRARGTSTTPTRGRGA
jgi:hypothetical protein